MTDIAMAMNESCLIWRAFSTAMTGAPAIVMLIS